MAIAGDNALNRWVSTERISLASSATRLGPPTDESDVALKHRETHVHFRSTAPSWFIRMLEIAIPSFVQRGDLRPTAI
jgi:hypothetical protein